MKVLHLIAGDLTGGAARGAYWLHRGLLSNGIESRVLTDSNYDFGDETVFSVAKGVKGRGLTKLRRLIDYVPTLLYPNREKAVFSTGLWGFDFTKEKPFIEADIVHLHWVNMGFVNIRHLKKVGKPIVWTLRDMWPATGGCHVPMNCQNYKTACGKCPQLGSHSELDLSRLIFRTKQKNIPQSLQVVGISRWISERAQESTLFRAHDVKTIFNNIDTQSFYPENKDISRSKLGLDTPKKIILLGAQSLDEFHKGFGKAIEAIACLDKKKFHLCLFGNNIDRRIIARTGLSYTSYGFLRNAESLRAAYSAADVFVSPSLMDAFGKTIAEAMACGTPAVCFDTTGPRDIVEHKVNGYRAAPYDAADLAKGIDWVIDNADYEGLAERSRRKIVSTFDSKLIAKQYVDLYRGLLGGMPN